MNFGSAISCAFFVSATFPAIAGDFRYKDKIIFMTFYGNGGSTSAEAQIMTARSPDTVCRKPNVIKFQLSATLGAPTPGGLTRKEYVDVTSQLLAAYMNATPITIIYNCPPNLSARIIGVN